MTSFDGYRWEWSVETDMQVQYSTSFEVAGGWWNGYPDLNKKKAA